MLALGIGIAGYSLLLQVQRGSSREVATASPVPEARKLPAPERLAARSASPDNFVPASVAIPSAVPSTVAIVVRDLLAGIDLATAGVAVFAQQTGAELAWLPLASAAVAADGSWTFEVPTQATGELSVALATHRDFARHGYFARRIVAVERHTPRVEAVFEGAVSPVQFTMPAGARLTAPLRVVRADDGGWLPMHIGSAGLYFDPGPTNLPFGAGNYELVDPIDAARRQSFVVPTTGPVVISEALSRPRAGRS